MAEELHLAITLEGTTAHTPGYAGEPPDEPLAIKTTVIINCGLSGWGDYRGEMFTIFDHGDMDEEHEELRFSGEEELSKWVESTITALRTKGYAVKMYKANGLPVDWLQGINLPPEDTTPAQGETP